MSFDLWQGVVLAGAGFLSGALNAAAGGGSLISFPALLWVGYPPIIANVTNNVSAVPGYVGGGWGYREYLSGQRGRIVALSAASTLGSAIGVFLILKSSRAQFEGVVPFLVLMACALLALQPYLGRILGGFQKRKRERPGLGALVAQTLAAVYGGYFGAALGVAVLALLGIAIDDSLQRINALKAFLQIVIGGVAAVGFILLTPVAWGAVAIVAPASIVGGRFGAWVAQRLSDRVLRVSIIVYGVTIAGWLFMR
ncbi:sulfite exporter TauE/SafE family protein [Rubrobacter calidifluminis]|uniref:sulfite exporter TauE/SafE family protein n=1 Tax=Rubrobacter calidifluminis TaxID=1392640 RepID=UPI0023620AF9|nr:sulfite exporter TauE/SafE family protein [Rubrobacter calidifluminis]